MPEVPFADAGGRVTFLFEASASVISLAGMPPPELGNSTRRFRCTCRCESAIVRSAPPDWEYTRWPDIKLRELHTLGRHAIQLRVLIVGCPKQPKSPYPRSSAKITTMFGFPLGSAITEGV